MTNDNLSGPNEEFGVADSLDQEHDLGDWGEHEDEETTFEFVEDDFDESDFADPDFGEDYSEEQWEELEKAFGFNRDGHLEEALHLSIMY